jgi:hypothetical protein
LVPEEIAQDAMSCIVQLMPASFSKRKEGDGIIAGHLQEGECDFYYPV